MESIRSKGDRSKKMVFLFSMGNHKLTDKQTWTHTYALHTTVAYKLLKTIFIELKLSFSYLFFFFVWVHSVHTNLTDILVKKVQNLFFFLCTLHSFFLCLSIWWMKIWWRSFQFDFLNNHINNQKQANWAGFSTFNFFFCWLVVCARSYVFYLILTVNNI